MINEKNKFLSSVEEIKKMVGDYFFKMSAKKSVSNFTRRRKMPFENIIYYSMNLNKKSMVLELDDFIENVLNKKESEISKQAISDARQNIDPEAFALLYKQTVQVAYRDDDFKTYKGYRLLAVDGSAISLYNTKEMREFFGSQSNKYSEVAMAQASLLYDIENDVIVDAILDRYEASERDIAVRHIKELEKYGDAKNLILFDRGYPSTELISELNESGIYFLMRVSSHFLKEINNFKGTNGIIEIKGSKSEKIKLRIIRAEIESTDKDGNRIKDIETLISNIIEPCFTIEDFKLLYAKRWGIETEYDLLKNKLELENFTGMTSTTVLQDFYITMMLANMVSFAKAYATEKIQEKNNQKNLKYEYKANTNIIVGQMKNKFIRMVMEEDEEKRNRMYEEIMLKIQRSAVPIRPNRTAERKKTKVSNKYPINKKRCL